MHLFDANVILDIITADPIWRGWSEERRREANLTGSALINPIIYAELVPAFGSLADLDRWLKPSLFDRLSLPCEAGWSAAQAFMNYRRRGGLKTTPLPDFFIGAHAEYAGLAVVTRDAARYSTYFPTVRVISP